MDHHSSNRSHRPSYLQGTNRHDLRSQSPQVTFLSPADSNDPHTPQFDRKANDRIIKKRRKNWATQSSHFRKYLRWTRTAITLLMVPVICYGTLFFIRNSEKIMSHSSEDPAETPSQASQPTITQQSPENTDVQVAPIKTE